MEKKEDEEEVAEEEGGGRRSMCAPATSKARRHRHLPQAALASGGQGYGEAKKQIRLEEATRRRELVGLELGEGRQLRLSRGAYTGVQFPWGWAAGPRHQSHPRRRPDLPLKLGLDRLQALFATSGLAGLPTSLTSPWKRTFSRALV